VALLLLASRAGAQGALPIAGQWAAADWGEVTIAADGSGTYTDTYGTGPGRLQIRRTDDGRYEGTWGESSERHGTLVLVLAPDGRTLTGSWTPDPQSTIGTTTGGPIQWSRRRAPGPAPGHRVN